MDLVDLHGIKLQFEAASATLRSAWRQLFAGWHVSEQHLGSGTVTLSCRLSNTLPTRPQSSPLYADHEQSAGRAHKIAVYPASERAFTIYFEEMGEAHIDTGRSQLRATIQPDCLTSGRFPDLIFTALAPILRRQSVFLLHSFGLWREGRIRLLIGPNGSGKSSLGLAHILAGWRFLGNDIMLVKALPDGVWAWPAPGEIAVRPDTLVRLPHLRAWLANDDAAGEQQRLDATQIRLHRGGQAGRVNELWATEIAAQASSAESISPAQMLGRLLTNSVDRWDTALFAEHAAVLRLLVEQSRCRRYLVGPELTVL